MESADKGDSSSTLRTNKDNKGNAKESGSSGFTQFSNKSSSSPPPNIPPLVQQNLLSRLSSNPPRPSFLPSFPPQSPRPHGSGSHSPRPTTQQPPPPPPAAMNSGGDGPGINPPPPALLSSSSTHLHHLQGGLTYPPPTYTQLQMFPFMPHAAGGQIFGQSGPPYQLPGYPHIILYPLIDGNTAQYDVYTGIWYSTMPMIGWDHLSIGHGYIDINQMHKVMRENHQRMISITNQACSQMALNPPMAPVEPGKPAPWLPFVVPLLPPPMPESSWRQTGIPTQQPFGCEGYHGGMMMGSSSSSSSSEIVKVTQSEAEQKEKKANFLKLILGSAAADEDSGVGENGPEENAAGAEGADSKTNEYPTEGDEGVQDAEDEDQMKDPSGGGSSGTLEDSLSDISSISIVGSSDECGSLPPTPREAPEQSAEEGGMMAYGNRNANISKGKKKVTPGLIEC